MTDKETKPSDENDEKPTREDHAEFTRKLLRDQNIRKKSEKLDWVQKRDAEEKSQGQETENDV